MSDLPNGWAEPALSEVVEILDSKRIPLNATEREGRIAGKSPEELYPYFGATGRVGLIDDFIFNEHLVLLGEDGVPFFDPLRHKAYQVEGKCWVNNHAHVLRPINSLIDNSYLTHFLNIFDYTGYITGSTRLKLTQESMRSIPIMLAPINEQKRIADKLDMVLARVDACREHLDRLPGILKRFRQAVIAAATSGYLTVEWRDLQTHCPAWQNGKLGSLLDGKPRNGYSPRSVNFETPVRVLSLSATTTGRFLAQHFKYVDEDIPESSHLWLKPGDVLVQRANTLEYVGISVVYDGPSSAFIYPDLMMKCRVNKLALPKFLNYILLSEPVRKYFRENATGTAGNMPKINQQTVLTVPVSWPSINEQTEIIRRVESLFAFADALDARYTAARVLADRLTPALLAKAFRGELVPQDPNDEPADALLARIHASGTETAPTPRKPRGRPKISLPKAPKEKAKMTKSRNDQDVRNKGYLAAFLRQQGTSMPVEELFRVSELPLNDFYKQLAWEIEHGHIKDDSTHLEVL